AGAKANVFAGGATQLLISYLLLKRSLCWLRLGQVEHALSDAKVCRELKPDWPKECFREGDALRLLQRFDKTANAFYERVNQGDH
uniref:Uncharacterized protein n=1 Tax=Brassica oleracea var. oleracea TaxID=109376 RepID=A0A0D3A3Z6_BRAOL